MFYFMSVHSEVILDPPPPTPTPKKQNKQKTALFLVYYTNLPTGL